MIGRKVTIKIMDIKMVKNPVFFGYCKLRTYLIFKLTDFSDFSRSR
jgi:hypothetical protein